MNKIAIFLLLCIGIVMAELPDDKSAPTFFVRTLDGKSFYLSEELRNGKPIVLSFFATWCLPCRVEIPIIDSLRTEFPDVSFYLVDVGGLEQGGVKLKEDPEKVKKMIESLKVEIPVLMDKYGLTAEKYGALILPKLIVIDKHGKIAYDQTGYQKGDELGLIKTLRKLKNADE